MDLKSKLQELIKGEILDDDQQTLQTYSKDASIFEITPQLVVAPKDSSDIQKLVKYVTSHKGLSLTPRSAGTDMSGGAINDSIILDMTRHFNRLISINQNSALTQPGVFYRDFEKETLKHNLLLPCYPASRDICTVGGMVANNSAGEKTLSLGQTKDYVKKIKVVLSDGNEYEIYPMDKEELDKKIAQKNFEGEVYKNIFRLIDDNFEMIQEAKPDVSKNSTGYLLWDVWDKKTFDLTKLFVGSQGTLGIITEVEFRLTTPKPDSRLLVVFLNSLDNLAEIINEVLRHEPESFESYDDQTLKVALRFLPELIKQMGSANLVHLFWQFLPEFWMSISGGFPKLILLAEFTGDTANEKLISANNALKRFNLKTRLVKTESEAKKYWTIRRESFNLLRHHSTHMRTAPFIDDIIVKPETLQTFLPKLKEILDQYQKFMIYTIAGHIGNGNFHIIPLMDLSDPNSKGIIKELSDKVYSLVFEYRGSMSAEHNDGLVRGPYLKQMYGEKMLRLFRQVKSIFDPEDIFNPHKKTDATFEYSLAHLSNEQVHPHSS